MRIRVPVMIQDPRLSGHKYLKRIVERPYVDDDFFLDGPVSKRVAIRKLDPATGTPRPGVRFLPPSGGRTLGRYQIADEKMARFPNVEPGPATSRDTRQLPAA